MYSLPGRQIIYVRDLTRAFDAAAGSTFVVCQQMSRAFCAYE